MTDPPSRPRAARAQLVPSGRGLVAYQVAGCRGHFDPQSAGSVGSASSAATSRRMAGNIGSALDCADRSAKVASRYVVVVGHLVVADRVPGDLSRFRADLLTFALLGDLLATLEQPVRLGRGDLSWGGRVPGFTLIVQPRRIRSTMPPVTGMRAVLLCAAAVFAPVIGCDGQASDSSSRQTAAASTAAASTSPADLTRVGPEIAERIQSYVDPAKNAIFRPIRAVIIEVEG